MNARKSADFVADVERQFEWYAVNASWDIAERYLAAVETACNLVGQYPKLGPMGGFVHPRLRDWRFIVVFRPVQKHLLFYEVVGGGAVMRRAAHGQRNLPRTLLEPPGLG